MASSPEVTDGRRAGRRPAVIGLGVLAAAVVVLFGVARLVGDGDGASVVVDGAVDPVAPVALPGGGFLYAERTTGRIVRVDADGRSELLASVPDDLRTDGQRGLLGLALGERDGRGALYASWTRAEDDRLMVGEVTDRGTVLVWQGPVTTELANGGTLAFRGDDLLIGVGELQDPDAVDDPTTPNGKVLALDPHGPPGQVPVVVSAGWHNPFALTVVGDDVWLVDNAPGSEPERVVRIGPDGRSSVVELSGKRAPSSLAVLPDGDLVLCGYVSGVVERIPVPAEGVRRPSGELGPPCATGVAVLADGSLVTTTVDAVWRDPDPG